MTDADVSRCVSRHPGILLISEENFLAKAEYFSEVLSAEAARRLATSSPSVYSLSLNTLTPRLSYLFVELWPSRALLSKRVEEYPVVLTLEVKGNVKPTLEVRRSRDVAKADGLRSSLL